MIVHETVVLVIAAAALIPFTIGLAFLADYNLQRAELERIPGSVGNEKL